ncbi:MAG TPA: transglycosylase SLT domain-containing protein [Chitinophagaceae bacterium]|nr:transglycosylase SLT domain-containing protein [Chitinophagaceae bacterium]
MKRLLVILVAAGFLSLSINRGHAQSKIEVAAEVDGQNSTELAMSDSADTQASKASPLTLFPVTEKVVYSLNSFTNSFNYPRLVSQESFFTGTRSLTTQEEQYLHGFIQKYFRNNDLNFQSIHSKSSKYFNTITKVFDQYGVPEDLKYLAVIESNLNTHARSYVGAVGLWQFMASTARFLGLKVNAHQDERTNLYKSTVAAAKYLNYLHGMFNNWILVVAAYNSGPARVQDAIASSNSDVFWDIKQYLPHESQNHVMKFLATAYIMKRFAHFFGVDKGENGGFQLGNMAANTNSYQPDKVQTLATISLSGQYSLAVIAQYTKMNLRALKELNVNFTEHYTQHPDQPYTLYLPADKMILFKKNQNKITNKSIDLFAKNNL